jgi:hypothetical protein
VDGTLCHDCGVDTLPAGWGERAEYYMVHDEVWANAGMGPLDGLLCVGCLERRLRRRLVPDDFTEARMNDLTFRATPRFAWSYRTRRLRDRLAGRDRRRRPAPDPAQGRLFELDARELGRRRSLGELLAELSWSPERPPVAGQAPMTGRDGPLAHHQQQPHPQGGPDAHP